MIRMLPIIDFPLSRNDFFYGLKHFFNESSIAHFSHEFRRFVKSKYAFPVRSGLAAFYVILQTLKNKSAKKEVILPAYTATALVNTVLQSGLKPVYCDISLKDFNLDRDGLLEMINPDTLAVLFVHMFGIVIDDIAQIKSRIPGDIFLIEDCAQGLGSTLDGLPVGCLGHVGFYSFNRGKNLSTLGGGCIVTNDEEIAKGINEKLKDKINENLFSQLIMPIKFLTLALLLNPFMFGLFYPLINFLRSRQRFKEFTVKKYSFFKAAVALMLLSQICQRSQYRYHNGMKLIEGLKGLDGIILPEIKANTRPAFNRLPIVFKDREKLILAEKALSKLGIETSRMYLKSLNQSFDLGYKTADLPNADYFAGHLLTLPVHTLVKEDDLSNIISALRQVVTE